MNPELPLFQKVTIIGHGAVGSALRDQFKREGILYAVWDRKTEACEPPEIWDRKTEACEPPETYKQFGKGNDPANPDLPAAGVEKTSGPGLRNYLGDWIFLSVPDNSLPNIVEQLVEIPCSWQGKTVIHLSGILSPELLKPLAEKGASTGSMHPLQTFTSPGSAQHPATTSPADQLHGIFYSLMGDPHTVQQMARWVRTVQGTSAEITQDQKSMLHLAAVFGSNYMVSLFHAASSLLDQAIPFSVFEPILRTTLNNVLSKGAGASLSGPVRRGDTDTVRKHLALLQKDPARYELYRLLGLEALQITEEEEKNPTPEKAAHIHELKKIFSAK